MKILHVSDLHFGSRHSSSRPHASTHYYTKNGEPDPKKLAEIISRDDDCGQVSCIVISGDLVWNGTAEEYGLAHTFVSRVGELWPKIPLVVCPGNHDVDRGAAIPVEDRQADYLAFANKLYSVSPESSMPLPGNVYGRDGIVSCHLLQGMFVATVNSAARLDTTGIPVIVGPDALEGLQGAMSELGVPQNALRTFVLHHHLFPFSEPPATDTISPDSPSELIDDSMVANSAKLQSWLDKNGFHLVLHGHKHISHGRHDTLWRPDDPSQGRSILVASAGSAGVSMQERPEPLSYNLIEALPIGGSSYEISVRVKRISGVDLVESPAVWYSYGRNIGIEARDCPLFSLVRQQINVMQQYGPPSDLGYR